MTKILADAPAVRLAIPLLFGGYLGWYNPLNYSPWWLFAGLLFVVALLVSHIKSSFKFRWIFGVSTTTLCVMAGYLLILNSTEQNLTEPPKCCRAVVIAKSVVLKSERYQRCDAAFVAVFDSIGARTETSGNVRLSIFNCAKHITPGDTLLVEGDFKKPVNFCPPSEFNYVAFLKTKGIGTVGQIKGDRCLIIGKASSTDFWALSRYLNKIFTERIENSPTSEDVKGVLKAFIIGDKSRISEEVRNDVAVSGLMHILTVSGLHTGIVFLVFSFLFKSVRKRRIGLVIYGLVSIIALWLYAAITGLAPSVCRAALMFTIMVLGQCLGRRSLSLNSVALAAIILFLHNPIVIAGLSFQLSFSAVTGIILANPLLQYLRTSSYSLNFLIPIAFISLVATLSTLPLILYHFGQFSSYFILSNLVILPFMPLVMYGGFLAVIFDIRFLWQVLDTLLSFFLDFIKWIAHLPGASITGIEMSWIGAILLAACLLCFFNWLVNLKTPWGVTMVLCLFAVLGLDTLWGNDDYRALLCVYSTNGYDRVLLHTAGRNYDLNPEDGLMALDTLTCSLVDSVSDLAAVCYTIEERKVAISRLISDIKIPLSEIDLLMVKELYIQPKTEKQLANYSGTLVVFNRVPEDWQKKLHRMGINYYSITDSGALEFAID